MKAGTSKMVCPKFLNISVLLQNANQILAVISMRVSQAYEM
jgi:hypothetical protein